MAWFVGQSPDISYCASECAKYTHFNYGALCNQEGCNCDCLQVEICNAIDGPYGHDLYVFKR